MENRSQLPAISRIAPRSFSEPIYDCVPCAALHRQYLMREHEIARRTAREDLTYAPEGFE
jgi:hypothetical protein